MIRGQRGDENRDSRRTYLRRIVALDPVDEAGDIARAETLSMFTTGDVAGAAIQHAEQGQPNRLKLLRSRCWLARHDRARDQSSYDAGATRLPTQRIRWRRGFPARRSCWLRRR